MSTNNKNHIQKGFTLVEMAVIAPIVILVIGTFIYAIITMTGDVMAGRAANILAYNIQDTLNRIETDFKISGGYLTDPASIMQPISPQGSNDVTDKFTAGPGIKTLIINSFATTKNPADNARSLVYTTSPNPCANSSSTQNPPLMLNVIYFIKDSTLWRRVIMPSDYATAYCGIPWQQPSCTSIGIFCKTNDEKLIENLDSDGLNIIYDKFAGLDKLGAITVTIKATSTVAGRNVTKSGTISAINAN